MNYSLQKQCTENTTKFIWRHKMCGIVGVALAESGSARDELLSPLRRLEYRGYDSCGFATTSRAASKQVGKISDFIKKIDDTDFRTGIAHTRWATHGGKSSLNAHPHVDVDKKYFVVHNGIIENYNELRSMLEREGYEFITETDTEIIPHYFHYHNRKMNLSILETIKRFYQDVRGTYAVLLIEEGYEEIYAFKKDSPLVLGLGDDFNIVASDIYAFSDKTQTVIFFEDFQACVITCECFQFYDINNKKIQPSSNEIERPDDEEQHDFPYYMIKEIYEQPLTAQRLFLSLRNEQTKARDKFSTLIDQASKIFILACGTSHHAGMVGRSMLLPEGLNVQSVVASDFDTLCGADPNTFIIAISQSGETMDVVTALKKAKDKGAKIGAITNSQYSTIERLSDVSMNILAGQEVAVASTKAFTNQVIALMAIASDFTTVYDLQKVPLIIADTISINEARIMELAKVIAPQQHVFFLGRRTSYPVALEMALKLKEISYIHAEGMMAAELKHGSIALIDPDEKTPAIVLAPKNDEHMLSTVAEVAARGANTIVISDEEGSYLRVPSNNDMEFAIGASVIGQLLSYYTAQLLGREIDQPRNLAKSVTVG